MKIIIYFITLFFCSNSISQNFKNKNFNNINIEINQITKNKDFILIELAESEIFILIKENNKKYLKLVYSVNSSDFFLKEVSYVKSCEKLFNYNNYKFEYIDHDSAFYKDKNANFDGSNFCFALVSKDKKLITEINITTFVDILPYEKKNHVYLLNLIKAFPDNIDLGN